VELVEGDFVIEGEAGEFKRERTRGGGRCGAHRTGMGRACGAMRACVEKGRKRRLAALSKDAVAKVMAKATENMSCSLMSIDVRGRIGRARCGIEFNEFGKSGV
jgi:hypothetical protein